MRLTVLCLYCGFAGSVLPAATDGSIAFLKGSAELYITDANGRNPRRLDHDPRGKSMLRWDGYRNRISYLVAGEHGEAGEKAIIVELDAGGNAVMEAPIPQDVNMRFVEDFDWQPNGKARLGGSMNPRNCILEDLDPANGIITNWQAGECGSFVRSPDGNHTAELGPTAQTDDEHRFEVVDIDSRMFASLASKALYRGGGQEVFIPGGPVWSPDSQSVVFLEKRAGTGEAAIIFLTLDGVAARVPVPAFVLDHPMISWVGSKVVVGEGANALEIDAVTKQTSAVTSNTSDEISRNASTKRQAEAVRANVDDLVKRLGGREGILLGTGTGGAK